MTPFPIKPEDLACEIGIPLDLWPGNCHGVAEAVLRRAPIAGMRLARGHYDGYVDRSSVYRSSGTQQHSWLVLADGRILDPTRWAMESPEKPFVYCGENDNYDEAGLELRARLRPQISFHVLMAGSSRGPVDVILEKITPAPRGEVERLLAAGAIRTPSRIDRALAERIHDRLNTPIEHHLDPEGFFQAALDLGLSVLAPIDSVRRVLEPEHTHVAPGANRLFDAPPRAAMSDMQKLFAVFCRFLSIEARESTIESELEEVGLTLENLHDALNTMETCLKHDPDLTWMPREARCDLAVAASEMLGRGLGMELRVERFAASLDLDRYGLHRSLTVFGAAAGYDLPWLCGDEARRAEEKTEILTEGLIP